MTPRGISADAVWDTVQGKAVPREPQLAAESREVDGDFDGLLVDWREKGHTVTLAGREALPGGDAYKLTVTLKSGLARTIYLDAKTYLDRRHTGMLNLPNGRRFDITIDFDNWRDVEGVKFPFDITEERTGKEPVVTLVTYTDKIEVNVPMDDALFSPEVTRRQKTEDRRQKTTTAAGRRQSVRAHSFNGFEDRGGRAVDVILARPPVRDRDAHGWLTGPRRAPAPAHAGGLDRGNYLICDVLSRR